MVRLKDNNFSQTDRVLSHEDNGHLLRQAILTHNEEHIKETIFFLIFSVYR